MALVSSIIPNLVGGVNQQPPQLRPLSVAEECTNAWTSVVTGNHKRQPSVFKSVLYSSAPSGDIACHMIDRRGADPYLVTVSSAGIKVTNVSTGVDATVNTPDGIGYISGGFNGPSGLRFLTIADTTFIINRSVVVAEGSLTSLTRLDPDTNASVYVTQSVANINYSVYINGVLKGNYTTPSTGAIPDTVAIAGGVASSLASNGVVAGAVGSTVCIAGLAPTDTVSARDGYGDEALRAYKDTVEQFIDLPPNDLQNRLVRVKGSVETASDDYYVVYDAKRGWVETAGYNAQTTLDASTMPWVLVDNLDGTWTFKKYDKWAGRTCGDAESNKLPSFVGFTINDMFVYKNRLGITADENVILSEVGEFGNFFRTTLTQLLDSDPIDVASITSRVSRLNFGIPFNQSLLLFSDRAQFTVTDNNNLLSPKTVGLVMSASFSSSPDVRPVNIGPNVLFVEDPSTSRYASLYEYYIDKDTSTDDAGDITAHVSRYVPRGVYKLTSSTDNNTVVILTSGDVSSLYVYKYFWNGNDKVQNSWTRWTLPSGNVRFAEFVDNVLYLVVSKNGSLLLLTMDLEDGASNFLERFGYLLDYRVSNEDVVSHVVLTSSTEITLPYTPDNTKVYTLVTSEGYVYTSSSITGDTLTFDGTVIPEDAEYSIGLDYEWKHTFSRFFVRTQVGQGTSVVSDGRLQITYLNVRFSDTATFTTSVKTQGRDAHESIFTGRLVGAPNNILGGLALETGEYRFAIYGNTETTEVTLKNTSPFPSCVTSAEWEGHFTPVTRKV